MLACNVLTPAPPGHSPSQRTFLLIATALLLVMIAAHVASMEQESQTVDESYHLLAGYQFLKTGEPPAHHEQPPLAQVIAALPLLPWNLRIPDVRPLDP